MTKVRRYRVPIMDGHGTVQRWFTFAADNMALARDHAWALSRDESFEPGMTIAVFDVEWVDWCDPEELVRG